jgi:putative membrane protein
MSRLVKQALMSSERTWLAWWRSALVATAGALAVGRVAPQALHVASWPYVALGVGYGVLAIGMTVVGARRHRRLTNATLSAVESSVGSRAIGAFTAGGVLISVCTIALVLAQS